MTRLHQSPSITTLQRLFLLRNIAIVGQCVVISITIHGLRIPLPLTSMIMVIGMLVLLNALTWLRLKQIWPVTDQELFTQLLLDVAELSMLLYLSGGSTNPFISFYLLPLSIAAATLPRSYSWGMTALTAVCYTLLMFYFIPLPHVHEHHGNDFNMHIYGMWFTFLLSAGMISYFVVNMSESLRDRDRLLAQVREEALRNEQIIALGTLAAGAAHELGTPLSTMAVVVREMELDFSDRPELLEYLRILSDQVDGCKRTLTQLLAQSDVQRAEGGNALSVDRFLKNILTKWQLMRPETRVDYHGQGVQPTPMIIAEQTLSQAILNLLNNAADAAPENVEVAGYWTASELVIEIRDRGPGLTPDAMHKLGQPFFTTKGPGNGFGLGLFLSNATISRFGGKVSLFSREAGGTCTRILLPLPPPSRGTLP